MKGAQFGLSYPVPAMREQCDSNSYEFPALAASNNYENWPIPPRNRHERRAQRAINRKKNKRK